MAHQSRDKGPVTHPTNPNSSNYLANLTTYNPIVQAVLDQTVQPSAFIHGIPVLVKDNVDTIAMGSSAGSIALSTIPVTTNAFLVNRIQQLGYNLVGKTNLSEWANFRSTRSTSGWSSYGGITKNPYILSRSSSGSSSGSAVAIACGMAPVAIGTETDGSIISPAAHNGIVGIKPTLGMVSRSGIVPISSSQDTAGPMARWVTDAAFLLEAMTGYDEKDAATYAWQDKSQGQIEKPTNRLGQTDLKGQKIGYVLDEKNLHPQVKTLFLSTLDILRDLGAQVLDQTSIYQSLEPDTLDSHELAILLGDFKDDLAQYLIQRCPNVFTNLQDLMNFNQEYRDRVLPYFGQELFDLAWNTEGKSGSNYTTAKQWITKHFKEKAFQLFFQEATLDALVLPSNGPSWVRDMINGDRYTGGNTSLAAVSGWPSITVGMGHVMELPIGLSFVGAPWQDSMIIGMAQAFQTHQDVYRFPQLVPE
jgi:amidase